MSTASHGASSDGDPVEVGDEVSTSIRGIAAGGAGVGTLPDGRVAFVHRTAPGERIRMEVTELSRSWGRGRLLEVTGPAPGRRPAPCPNYGECGGCVLEHMEYPVQIEAKSEIVGDALRRIGKVEAGTPEVVPSPSEFRYRNRITPTLLRLGGERVVAGFHELENPGRIVDVGSECLLPEEEVADVWEAIRRSWGRGARRLPPGRRLRLEVRRVGDGCFLVVHGGGTWEDPEDLLRAVPGLVSLWQRRADDEVPGHVAGERSRVEAWHGEEIRIGGGAFVQANREAARPLEAHVLEQVGAGGGVRVVDAYCGAGLYARKLARRGARCVGIDADPLAVEAARNGAPDGARFLRGAVEDRLPEALPADVVIVNPPRTGLDDAVPGILNRSGSARVVYVSCDPATLARDVRRLSEAYALEEIRSFDLFPQTAHVETVAVLEGARRSATS